jgi:N4-gp56 family major capsid protein
MAMQTTTNPASNANQIQTYFTRRLMTRLTNELVFAQWGKKEDLQANMAAKVIRFFRTNQAVASNIASLTEGVAPTTFSEIDLGYIDCTLLQVGGLKKISDILQGISLFNWVKENVDILGEEMALNADGVVRNALVAGILAAAGGISLIGGSTGYFNRFAGVRNTGTDANDFATLYGFADPNMGKFTRAGALSCITQLRVAKIPKIQGSYAVAVSPAVLQDVRLDPQWTLAAQYNGEKLFKKEVVSIDGCKYVEADNQFIEKNTYGTYDQTGGIYTTLFIGRDAYGTPRLLTDKTGSSPFNPSIVILNKADKTDPLNQYTLVGVKAFWNATVLWVGSFSQTDPPRAVAYRSQSTFN